MAQDFRAAFSLGPKDASIATVDADGVALAAIQALNGVVRVQGSEVCRLKAENAELKKQLGTVLERLRALEGRRME